MSTAQTSAIELAERPNTYPINNDEATSELTIERAINERLTSVYERR